MARRYNDLDTGQITGGIYSWYDGKSEKTAFSGKVTKYADNFMGGSHDFKLGVQYNSGLGEYTYGLNDYIYTYGATPAYGYTQLPFTQGGRMKAHRHLRRRHLSARAAPRSTWASATTTARPTSPRRTCSTRTATRPASSRRPWTRCSAGSVVSPRLGVNFKLNDSGSSLLKAHYGRYYRGIVTGEFDNTTPSITPQYLFSGLYSAAGVPLDKELVSDNSQLTVDPNLKNPYTDQFILALEQQVGSTIGFSVSYVYKRSEQQTAFPDIGGTYRLVPYTAPAGANVPQVYQLTSGADSRLFQLTQRRPHVLATTTAWRSR